MKASHLPSGDTRGVIAPPAPETIVRSRPVVRSRRTIA
jgi:hypothetical protein